MRTLTETRFHEYNQNYRHASPRVLVSPRSRPIIAPVMLSALRGVFSWSIQMSKPVEHCGEIRTTPFCPECGLKIGDDFTLHDLLRHCERSASNATSFRANRKWSTWANQLRELGSHQSKLRVSLDEFFKGRCESDRRWFSYMASDFPDIEYIDQVQERHIGHWDTFNKLTRSRIRQAIKDACEPKAVKHR